MSVTDVQAASGFATAASQTFAATFSTAATAGNLIIYCIGGDKNIGTLTLSGFTKTIDTRSTDNSVSLVVAWKTAVGGETTISGTISGANAGGSEVRIFEWAEPGSGPWEVKGSAVNTSTGTTTNTLSSNTTGTITSAGRAIAAFSADSVGTEGTVSYDNSFTATASTPSSGAGNAGFWAAVKDIIAGTTAGTTITRTSGTADQMNGGVVVFGRAPAQDTAPTGIASAEAVGTPNVVQILNPTSIASEEAFGSTTVDVGDPHQTLTVTGIASAEAFGTTTLGGPIIFPVSLASAEAFGLTRFVQQPTRVQSRWIFLPKDTLTIDVPFEDQAAVAGNVLVFVGSFHHDIGTLTLTGSGWNYPVNLRQASLSLVIAWKTAAGGETGITGTFTQGNDTGSNMVAIEYHSQAPGQWAQFGTASHNSDATNVKVWSSGTTDPSIGDGIAVAGFGINNVGPDSTDSFSNSYTTVFAQGGGEFEAGVWAAEKLTAFGATAETTLTRAGVAVAAKTSGGVVIIGKASVQNIAPGSANAGEVFGQPDLPLQPQPPSIPSGEAFGTAVVAVQPISIAPAGIASAEAFGFAVVHSGPILLVTAINSLEAFGTAEVGNGVKRTALGGVYVTRIYLGGVQAKVYCGAVTVFQ